MWILLFIQEEKLKREAEEAAEKAKKEAEESNVSKTYD